MSLPAGLMISLTIALEGVYTLRLRDSGEHRVAAEEFFTGNNQNILHPGDLLRSIELLHRGYGLHAHKVRDDRYSTSRLEATSASFVLGVFRELRMYGVLGSWGA
jgi:CO/xanthine dehydrogenase FAD-binding subunit